MTIIKRVSEIPTDGTTKRVATNGAVPIQLGNTWGSTWGDTWGNTWSNITDAIRALPSVDATQRVSELPAQNITKRVTGL